MSDAGDDDDEEEEERDDLLVPTTHEDFANEGGGGRKIVSENEMQALNAKDAKAARARTRAAMSSSHLLFSAPPLQRMPSGAAQQAADVGAAPQVQAQEREVQERKVQEGAEGGELPDLEGADAWSEEEVALWLRCRSFEAEAALLEKDDFAQEINGKVLLRLCESDLRSLGISQVGRRLRLAEEIQMLRRIAQKTETRKLAPVPFKQCVLEVFTFSWANTSEGKGGWALKDEIIASNTNIAIISTLVFVFAWSFFFSVNADCYCPVKTGRDTDTAECYCRSGFDIRYKVPLSMFYCFSCMSCMLFLWSLLLAVCTNIAVNEMSDEEEIVEYVENVMGAWLVGPGTYLNIGTILSAVPITLYALFNHDFGLYSLVARTGTTDNQYTNNIDKALCFSSMLVAGILFLLIFFYMIPKSIAKVYQAKMDCLQKDVLSALLGCGDVPQRLRSAQSRDISESDVVPAPVARSIPGKDAYMELPETMRPSVRPPPSQYDFLDVDFKAMAAVAPGPVTATADLVNTVKPEGGGGSRVADARLHGATSPVYRGVTSIDHFL